MQTKDGIFIVSRAFALYLFIWTLVDISYFPTRLYSLRHYAIQSSVLEPRNYFYTLDSMEIGFNLLRIFVLATGSWVFYKCGPHVQGFFSPRE